MRPGRPGRRARAPLPRSATRSRASVAIRRASSGSAVSGSPTGLPYQRRYGKVNGADGAPIPALRRCLSGRSRARGSRRRRALRERRAGRDLVVPGERHLAHEVRVRGLEPVGWPSSAAGEPHRRSARSGRRRPGWCRSRSPSGRSYRRPVASATSTPASVDEQRVVRRADRPSCRARGRGRRGGRRSRASSPLSSRAVGSSATSDRAGRPRSPGRARRARARRRRAGRRHARRGRRARRSRARPSPARAPRRRRRPRSARTSSTFSRARQERPRGRASGRRRRCARAGTRRARRGRAPESDDAADEHLALVRRVEPGEQREQRRLARAGRARHDGERPRGEGRVDALERDLERRTGASRRAPRRATPARRSSGRRVSRARARRPPTGRSSTTPRPSRTRGAVADAGGAQASPPGRAASRRGRSTTVSPSPRRSSLIRPSRTWTTRSAIAADVGSWLTTSAAAPSLARELGEEVEHARGGRLVELAGRLVGDRAARASARARRRARSAAARRRRARAGARRPVAQADALEQLARATARRSGRGAPRRPSGSATSSSAVSSPASARQ